MARIKRFLKSVYYFLRGEPPISYSKITTDKAFLQSCIGKENPIIVEIGCNDGSHTLWFLGLFKNPKIYCFEPDPRAIARFKNKVGEHANIHLFEMALSDRDGERPFYQSGGQHKERDDWDLSGSIRKPKEHLIQFPWVTFNQTITVKTATLDAWCREQNIGHIDFIWMDVQGALQEMGF